jgi:23S rRNA (uracil1939-C5)-methyltransferase
VSGAARSAAPPRRPRRGERLELVVDELDARGRGVAHPSPEDPELSVTLEGLPGQRIAAEVLRRRGPRVEARALALVAPGPDDVEPPCPHERWCGGCAFQGLAYPAQLAALGRRVRRALEREGLGALPVEPVLGVELPEGLFGYRNKMEFTFSPRRFVLPEEPEGVGDAAPEGVALGLHPAGVFAKVLDLGGCAIAHPAFPPVLATARALARAQGLEAWDVRTHRGLLRHLVLRAGVATGELLVVLVTSERAPGQVEPFARALLARHPEITSLVQAVNRGRAAVAIGEEQHVLFGPGRIRERLCGLELEISPTSFFQTNTRQAELLFSIVVEEAGLRGDELVWDLYCGTGTIALVLAAGARAVEGFELVEAAVLDARANAARNGIDRARFHAGDVRASMEARLAEGSRPAVCVVDPPRAGLHPAVPGLVARLAGERIVYVSCNPEAAARDLAALRRLGWWARRVRPVDLFPHTPHVELVVALERAAGGERRP